MEQEKETNRRESQRRWYQRNRERAIAAARRWQAENKEQFRAYQNAYSKAYYHKYKHRYQAENAWIKPAAKLNGWTLCALSVELGYKDKTACSKMVLGIWPAPHEKIERILGVRKEDFWHENV